MRLFRTLVLAAIVAASWAAPASAGGSGATWMSCSRSTAELVSLDAVYEYYRLDYTASWCQPLQPSDRYAIAFYRGDGTAGGVALVPHHSGPASLSIYLDPSVVATCVLTGPDTRIACAEVVFAVDTLGLGAVIPPDAPLVSVPVSVDLDADPIQPVCPACW